MHGSPGGVRNQMGIAHGHGYGLVPHQRFDAVDVRPGYGQPGGEGVPQGVKDHFVPGILDVHVEPKLDDQFSKTVGQGTAFLSALRRRQDQTARDAAYFGCGAVLDACGGNQAFPEHHLHVGIDEDLSTGFPALLLPHGDDAVGDVHVHPFKTQYLAKAHAGVHPQDDGCVQVRLSRGSGGLDQRIGFFVGEKALPGVLGFGQGHAFERTLPGKDGHALNFRHPGHVVGPAQDRHVVQGRGLGSALLPQKVQKGADVVTGDGGKGQVPQVRNDLSDPAVVVAPGALAALGLGHVVVGKEVGNCHPLHAQAANFLRFGLAQGVAFGPKGSETLGAGAGLDVLLDAREHPVGLLRVPALGSPAEPFLAVLVIDVIADAEVAIRLAAMTAAAMFPKSDAGVRRAVPTRFHGPGIVPEQIPVKGLPGKDKQSQMTDIIGCSMTRYDARIPLNLLRNQQVRSSSLLVGSKKVMISIC